MSIPRRALIAITSAHAELFEGGGHTTGVFIGEALHPYNVFKAAGFEIDIVSEKGTWTEDWLSLQPGFLSTEERQQYDDKSSEFRKDMDANIKAADVLDKEVSFDMLMTLLLLLTSVTVRCLFRVCRTRRPDRLPSRSTVAGNRCEGVEAWRHRVCCVSRLSEDSIPVDIVGFVSNT
jgi:hypothetical protein